MDPITIALLLGGTLVSFFGNMWTNGLNNKLTAAENKKNREWQEYMYQKNLLDTSLKSQRLQAEEAGLNSAWYNFGFQSPSFSPNYNGQASHFSNPFEGVANLFKTGASMNQSAVHNREQMEFNERKLNSDIELQQQLLELRNNLVKAQVSNYMSMVTSRDSLLPHQTGLLKSRMSLADAQKLLADANTSFTNAKTDTHKAVHKSIVDTYKWKALEHKYNAGKGLKELNHYDSYMDAVIKDLQERANLSIANADLSKERHRGLLGINDFNDWVSSEGLDKIMKVNDLVNQVTGIVNDEFMDHSTSRKKSNYYKKIYKKAYQKYGLKSDLDYLNF